MSQENKQEIKEKIQNELLSQLHEQYAVNNNANLSSMVTLIVGVIAILSSYGYIFVHTVDDFGCCNGLFIQGESFTMTTLLLTYLSILCILAILMRLCIYQGIAQRKEQFIIKAIREHYDEDKTLENLLPKSYNKIETDEAEVIQGLFGEFVKIFRSIMLWLTIITLIRAILALFPIFCICCQNIMWVVVTIVAAYFVYNNCVNYRKEHCKKCRDRADEYNEK